MPPETWQGAEPSRSAVKRWQRWRQRRRRARNLPPRPQPPGDAAEPPEKVCKLPAGAARTPGHLAGGQAGARGLTPSRVLSLLLPPLPQGCPRSWWARAPGGDDALGGHLAFAPGAEGSRVARLCLRSLLQPPPASLRPVLAGIITSSPPLPQMTAAALPRRRGGSSWRRNLYGLFSKEPLKLFTKFLEGQDVRRNQGDVFSLQLHPASSLPKICWGELGEGGDG